MTVMRRGALALSAVLLLASGCDGTPAGSPGPSPSRIASPANPVLAQACADVTKTINDETTAFTSALAKAVAAGERRDTAAQSTAFAEIKAAFADWAAKLRGQADRATDPELKAVLTEYAGAVDADIARVRTVAELDKLSTFDDQALDTAASRLADICG